MLSPLNPMGGGGPMLRPINVAPQVRQSGAMYPQQQHGMLPGSRAQYPQQQQQHMTPSPVRTATQQQAPMAQHGMIQPANQGQIVPHDEQMKMLQVALAQVREKQDFEDRRMERERERRRVRDEVRGEEAEKAEKAAKAKKVALHQTAPAPKARFFTLELNFWVLCALLIIVVLLILGCTTQSKVSGLKTSVDTLGQRVQRLETVLVRQHNQLRAVVGR